MPVRVPAVCLAANARGSGWFGPVALITSLALNSFGVWLLMNSASAPRPLPPVRTMEITFATIAPPQPVTESTPVVQPPMPPPLAQRKPARVVKAKSKTIAPTPSSQPAELVAAAAASPVEQATPPVADGAPAAAPAAPIVVSPATETPPSFDATYLHNPEPEYPRVARRLGIQGTVVLRVLVAASGKPDKVEIATSSGFPMLDEAAINAVRGWSFVPARRGSEAIAAAVNVPVRFSLNRG